MNNSESQTTDDAQSIVGIDVANRGAMPRLQTALSLFALTLIPALVFFQLYNSAFIQYDDPDYVWFEPLVTNGLSWSGLYQSVASFRNSNWHPVTWWSLMLDHTLFGRNSRAFHLHNLLLHILNGCLLFLWLRKYVLAVIPSLLVAILFSIHPLHVEPVAWVSSRKDVLSACFFLCTLLAYGSYARRPGLIRYLFVMALYGLGLMSKSMLVTVPLLMLLIDVCLLRRWSRWPLDSLLSTPAHCSERADFSGEHSTDRSTRSGLILLVEKIPFVIMALGTTILCYQAQHQYGSVVDSGSTPVFEKLTQIVLSYAFYVERTFLPLNLTLHYPYVAEQTWSKLAAASAILIAAGWFAFRPGRARAIRIFGWVWYVISLLPVCGIVRLGALSTADRYSYIPLIGLFVMLVAALPLTPVDLPKRRRSVGIAALAVCSVLALLAHHQVSYWRNSETMFTHAVKVTPNSARIHSHLGIALERRGKMEDAERHLRESIRLFPDDRVSRCVLCKILTTQKDYQAALMVIAEAAQADVKVTRNLNVQSLTNGERRSRSGIFHLWGRALAAAGEYPDAIQKFFEARSIDDSLPLLHADLADALQFTGKFSEAAEAYRESIALEPDNWRWKQMLAHLLATCPETSVRNSTEAILIALQANRTAGNSRPECLDTLACGYAAQGDFDRAIQVIQLTIQSGTGRPEIIAEMEKHLTLFKSGQCVTFPAMAGSLMAK